MHRFSSAQSEGEKKKMSKNTRPPPPPGRSGAAKARQMGLLVDFSPDGMMDNDEEDGELEAELIAIVGGRPDSKEKPKGKTPLPMEAIDRMAALCMKDLDEEDGEEEEDLEDEDDLMAELNEVLGEEKEIKDATIPAAKVNETPSDSSSVESTLVERLEMYRTAIANAKQAGDGAKVRRYERGLKTLENMLTSVRKGRKIDEEEIPPAVALGKSGNSQLPSPSPLTLSSQSSAPNGRFSLSSHPPPQPPTAAPPQGPSAASPKPPPPVSPKPSPPVLPKPALSLPIRSPETPEEKPVPLSQSGSENSRTQALLQDRQREYKLAALHAKQQGNVEMASKYYRVAKSFDPILEALEKGETVDLGHLPPPPDQLPKELLSPGLQQQSAVSTTMPLAKSAAPAAELPSPPRDMLEALQQRMERYKTASAQAKSKGDDRKARMHERIVKQYQEAIRAHKAGKTVDFAELPVPPGFPPIHGMEASSGDQSIMGVLETAMKLASQEDRENDEEDDNVEGMKKLGSRPALSNPTASSQPKLVPRVSSGGTPAVANPAGTGKSTAKATTKAQQQLAFLEGRKKQLMQAALRAKQKNDIEGAKLFLRQAKGLDPMIEASQGGLPVDITKVPQAPVNKEDFVLVQRRGVSISPEAASQYMEFMKLMRQQHEMCLNYSKQFTHLGNIAETTKFEKMAEDCKKNMEILKQAHAKGFPLPKYHYEQRTFSVVKIFPELNSNDMVLTIVKGINLPAPPGVTPNDLDAFVRFEFPYPNAEEAQKDRTNVIKNTDSPEFKEQFKLYINRGHRGLKRVFQTKGLKFEVVHKGGLFKTDRIVGTAQLKLEALETICELREIVELLDGRRPTGGKLEVIVRLREPLSSQQLETRTEKWLVIDPQTMPAVALPKPKPTVGPVRDVGNSKPIHTLHSLNVLAFDKEKLEKKVLAYRQAHRQLPNELVEQFQDITQRSQWLKSQLQHGGPAFRKEYLSQLERFLQFYTDSARRLGNEGNRDAAKEALYKRNLVESELQKFRR
ncbi:coiled-coil and C2 domain-containing protein 1A isoform X2 [Gopherus evgoodei]|uniref:coiled-coil and C2 domain-containing protein 1A isoform X2 n=1 Tax=Gopherus evgoodei TaxID=1825980 RepID=UPI0011CF5BB3|nr:coiled-coil and C2 domain-containing protein 1A isoform X2 [Gopherus evgoodei]